MRAIPAIFVVIVAGWMPASAIAASPSPPSAAESPPAKPPPAGGSVVALPLGTVIPGVGTIPGNGISHAIPLAGYVQSGNGLDDGDYKSALNGLKYCDENAIRTELGRWVDSICYLTMAGECNYKMGHLSAALDNYNSALKVYLQSPNWMIGIQYPSVMPTVIARSSAPWGRSGRATKLQRLLPSTAVTSDQILFDPLNIAGGGAAAKSNPPSVGALLVRGTTLAVCVQEVARCTALALKRRYELMGQLCPHDPLSASVVASLSLRLDRMNSPHSRVFGFTAGDEQWQMRLAGPDPCSKIWIDAELGMAYLNTGQIAQAAELLKRSVNLPGGLDHPLTPLVLLELGELALQQRDYKSAANLLAEASYSGYDFGDLGVIQESFRYGHQAFLMLHENQPEMFPPLAAAIPWSSSHGRELHASLLLLAAEDYARLNQTASAAAALAQAKSGLVRREAATGEIGARLNCLSALVDYQQNRVAAGDQAIAAALDYEKSGSKWLFQIALADRFAAAQSNSALARQRTLPLFEGLLRDPAAADWSTDPLESLSVLATPLPSVYEHWFEAALQVSPELSLEVADRARRHRFLSTLPVGGRLMALRWALEAPAGAIDPAINPAIQLQRTELLTRYPRYAELAKAVRKLRAELAAMPLAAVGADAQRKQSEKLAELGKLSAEQETLLREMAVGREAADLAFPPLRKTKDVQAALPRRQYMLAFFATRDSTYAWLMSSNRCAMWKIESPPLLEKKIAAMLRTIGNIDGDHELPRNQLADETWKAASRDVVGALVAGSKVNLGGAIDELIVVPDGLLWHLPFEALDVGGAKPGDSPAPLLAKTRIRYLPTMGLAIPERQDRVAGEMGVALGKLHPRDGPELATAELQQLRKTATQVSAISKPLPAASPVYGSLFDTLVVLDDLGIGDKASGGDQSRYYVWSPVPLDSMRSAGSLANWFALPWKNTGQILLPGFHTAAENSLRQLGSARPGNDLFLSTCGLMSTGARSVLISRWRTGGPACGELMHQFAQELPYTGASDAWQRSVQLLWETPLDLDREPRISRAGGVEEATGRHPLFWSGYLLIDTGWTPAKVEKLAAAGE
jgi:hypothetical protein